mmetsp:Transcript_9464/g.29413  ORF Transcript_9464/g.29413 Transcript_9464/m.29413 type:complete len:239 (-) Transcript_9464:864-1580(-)
MAGVAVWSIPWGQNARWPGRTDAPDLARGLHRGRAEVAARLRRHDEGRRAVLRRDPRGLLRLGHLAPQGVAQLPGLLELALQQCCLIGLGRVCPVLSVASGSGGDDAADKAAHGASIASRVHVAVEGGDAGAARVRILPVARDEAELLHRQAGQAGLAPRPISLSLCLLRRRQHLGEPNLRRGPRRGRRRGPRRGPRRRPWRPCGLRLLGALAGHNSSMCGRRTSLLRHGLRLPALAH